MSTKNKTIFGVVVLGAIVVVFFMMVASRPKSLDETLKDFKFNIPKSSVAEVEKGIQEGIKIAQDEHDRKERDRQRIEDETQEMKDMLNAALAN